MSERMFNLLPWIVIGLGLVAGVAFTIAETLEEAEQEAAFEQLVTGDELATEEQGYLRLVRSILEPEFPEFARATDELTLEIGYQTCDILDEARVEGDPPAEALAWLMSNSIDTFGDDFGIAFGSATIGAAAQNLCPELWPYIDAGIEAIS